LLEPIAALTTIAVNLPAHRALTDAQNFGDAFLARPTLAQRIIWQRSSYFIRRYLLIGNLLQSQEVTPSSHHSIMRWLLESAKYSQRFFRPLNRKDCRLRERNYNVLSRRGRTRSCPQCSQSESPLH
jgi:hypothetical protein